MIFRKRWHAGIFDALHALPEVAAVRVRTAKPDAYDDCQQIAYELSNLTC
jgi:FtsZ-interacting cell division protein YlmF